MKNFPFHSKEAIEIQQKLDKYILLVDGLNAKNLLNRNVFEFDSAK